MNITNKYFKIKQDVQINVEGYDGDWVSEIETWKKDRVFKGIIRSSGNSISSVCYDGYADAYVPFEFAEEITEEEFEKTLDNLTR
jgi:hypothetical protein